MTNKNNIALWYGEIIADEQSNQHYWQVLDVAERAQAEKMRKPLINQRYIEVHGRLRFLLADYLQQQPRHIRIARTDHGKPYLIDFPDIVFNISHTGQYLVVVIGHACQLGVDLELCQPRYNLPGMVDKCFAPEEAAYWHAQPETQKTIEFHRFWTKKEAFVKATGRGIALGLNRCVVDPENSTHFLSLPSEYTPVENWRIIDLQELLPNWETPDLCGALVVDKNIENITYLTDH